MEYGIRIRPQAREDLIDAFKWYQSQREGLGFEFKMCVDEVFSRIIKQPKINKIIHKNIRRAIIKRFPFGIFYIIDSNNIIVLAVIHVRRNPDNWKDRI